MDTTKAAALLATQIAVVRSELGTPMVIVAGQFEYLASVAAYAEIVLQHGEAFRVLATSGSHFYFAAAASARSGFEAAVMAAWIREPAEKIRKEGRWLGIQEGMKKSHRNLAVGLADVDPTLDDSAAPLRAIHDLLKARKIDGKDIPLETKPNAEAMLKDIGFEGMYTSYRELCEIVHVGPEMVMRFKDGSESAGSGTIAINHRMFATDWVIPFLTIGWSISTAGMATLVELGAESSRLRKIHDAQVALEAQVRL